jgi:hypothetical protein
MNVARATKRETSISERGASPSAVASLKAIFSLLMGLSLTNALVVLIRLDKHNSVQWLSTLHTKPTVSTAVLLFTIVRFYLGNVRHIDDTYGLSPVTHSLASPNSRSARRFVVDFCVLLVEALMFGVASFYVYHASDLLAIMIGLLVVDTSWNRVTQEDTPHQQVWYVNNSIHTALMFGCYCAHLTFPHSVAWTYAGVALLLTNGSVDFAFSRAFYFADQPVGKSIFLSAPFTGVLDSEDRLPRPLRSRIETIVDRLEAHGWEVFNAHRLESWGASIETPHKALVRDTAAIRQSQQLVAIIGDPPSPGVQLEIGFALAHGKRVLVVCETSETLPFLMRGLIEHESTTCISGRNFDEDHELAVLVEQKVTAL